VRVSLDIPDDIDFQYVYRMVRNRPYEVSKRPDHEFRLLNSLSDGFAHRPLLTDALGSGGAIKAIAKLATSRRAFYTTVNNGRASTFGWCTVGTCRWYQIERDAVVIGPIETNPDYRGLGLAGYAMQFAINEYIKRGHDVFYIDTAKLNFPAQSVFKKCGFGDPVALYFRPFDHKKASA
jgi:GNAT superfamily N-acetyltransferase